MFKKSISFVGVLVLGVFGVLVVCDNDNPAAPESTDIVGSWYGLSTEQKVGASLPDTFVCFLKIENAGTYSMLRGRLCHGSSGSTTDSAKESGTYSKIGTDSVVLSPSGGTCYYWDPGSSWLKCDSAAASFFHECPQPMRVKIDISGTSWNATIPRFDDITSVTYSLKKQ